MRKQIPNCTPWRGSWSLLRSFCGANIEERGGCRGTAVFAEARTLLRSVRAFNHHNAYILGFWMRGWKGGWKHAGLKSVPLRGLVSGSSPLPRRLVPPSHARLLRPVGAVQTKHMYYLNVCMGGGRASMSMGGRCEAGSSVVGHQALGGPQPGLLPAQPRASGAIPRDNEHQAAF